MPKSFILSISFLAQEQEGKEALSKKKVIWDAEILVSVYLIAADLKARKLANALLNIGCDNSFCVPDLCELSLAFSGFDDRPNELYDYYFELLDQYCDKVTAENDLPIKEAFCIYEKLRSAQQKFLSL